MAFSVDRRRFGRAPGSYQRPGYPTSSDGNAGAPIALPLAAHVSRSHSRDVPFPDASTALRFRTPHRSPAKASAPLSKPVRGPQVMGKHDMLARSAVGLVYRTFSPSKCTQGLLSPTPKARRALFADTVIHKQSEALGLFSNSLRRGAAPVKPALAVGHSSTPSVKLSQGQIYRASAGAVASRQAVIGSPASPHSLAWHPLLRTISDSREKYRNQLSYQCCVPTSPQQPPYSCSAQQQSVVVEPILNSSEEASRLISPGVAGQVVKPVEENRAAHGTPFQSGVVRFHGKGLCDTGYEAAVHSSSCEHGSQAVSRTHTSLEFVSGQHLHQVQMKPSTFLATSSSEVVAAECGTQRPLIDSRMSTDDCDQAVMTHGSRTVASTEVCESAMQTDCSVEEASTPTYEKAPLKAGWCPTQAPNMTKNQTSLSFETRSTGCNNAECAGRLDTAEDRVDSPVILNASMRKLLCVDNTDGLSADKGRSMEQWAEQPYEDEDALSFTDSMATSREDSSSSPDIGFFENMEMDSPDSVENSLTMTVVEPMSAGTPIISSHPLIISELSSASPVLLNSQWDTSPYSHSASENSMVSAVPPTSDGSLMHTHAGAVTDSGHTEPSSCESPHGHLDMNDQLVDGTRILGKQYVVDKIVGEGAYGIVMKCHLRYDSSQTVAVKVFKITDSDSDAEDVKRTAHREAALMKQLHHDNITSLLDTFLIQDKLCICMEFSPRTLLELLESTNSGNGLDPDLVKKLIFQIMSAISFLHSQGIVFRDVKPENVLITNEMNVKLCDFGFARRLPPDTTAAGGTLTDYVATRWYRAPELLLGGTCTKDGGKWRPCYGKPVDVWSVGCLMAELLTGQPLFPGESDLDQLYKIMSIIGPLTDDQMLMFHNNPSNANITFRIKSHTSLRSHFDGHVPNDALAFLEALLDMDPQKRLCGDDVLMHPYFRGMP